MFKHYKPYHLNWKIISDIKLKPKSKSDARAVNKEEMLPRDLFEKLASNNYDYSFKEIFGILDIETGGEVYSFDLLGYPHSEVIMLFLEMGRKTKDFNELLNYIWLYIENDYVAEDPSHQFYRFFLCRGDEIVKDHFSLSDAPGSRLPNDILVEKTDYFFGHEREDMAAHVQILYQKWFKETNCGRIYAMKKKMELAEKARVSIDDPVREFEIKLLRNSLLGIRIALYILVALMIYAVFIK